MSDIPPPAPVLDSTKANDADDAGNDRKKDDDESDGVRSNNSGSPYSTEELSELIKAIKFAYPDYGIRRVHREIVEVASGKGKEPALADVKLNQVKKIWKKLGLSRSGGVGGGGSSVISDDDYSACSGGKNTISSPGALNQYALQVPTPDAVLKFYTVGDGSIQHLTKGYVTAAEAARQNLQENIAKNRNESSSKTGEGSGGGVWYHYYLDVPMDLSGDYPYQALINFNENAVNATIATDNKNDQKNDDNALTMASKTREEIVKIQVAATIDASDTKMPMLLYNLDRSIRTFIHPPSKQTTSTAIATSTAKTETDTNTVPTKQAPKGESDSEKDENTTAQRIERDSYFVVYNLITRNGVKGMLGVIGGTKAYFRCRIHPDKNIVSVDTSSLAPEQTW